MSIHEISTLSKNPHFFAFLIQCFLTGYNKPCELLLPFLALPILLSSDSRKKLEHATTRSKMETLYGTPQSFGEEKLSGKTALSGFLDRYTALQNDCKKAIIILSSENSIAIERNQIYLLKKRSYNDYKNKVKEWARVAYYLGLVFAKTDEHHLCYFLGVEKS